MDLIKILKNHLSFIITLVSVLAGIFVLFLIVTSQFYRNFIIVNTPYYIVLTFISLAPVAVLKKLKWYPEAAPLYSWAILFLFTGMHFAFFHEPDFIGFFFDMFHSSLTAPSVFSTFFGFLTISGVFTLYYSLMAFISNRKDNEFNLKIDIKTYSIWVTAFILYLNALISIVNPVFRRPF